MTCRTAILCQPGADSRQNCALSQGRGVEISSRLSALRLRWGEMTSSFGLLTPWRLLIGLYDSRVAMRRHTCSVDDRGLIQIVDSALADVTRRSGEWLVCRPGCTQCCVGAFPINQLDAQRMRRGLDALEASLPERAGRIRERARDSVARLSAEFPGDPVTGLLDEGDEATGRFSDFANDEPCPALDPLTGHCELYESRPMTCRVFGPPVRSEDGLGVCELCFQGATDEEIARCEMKPDPDHLESGLVEQVESTTGVRGNTIVPFCLVS
jgi:Fe-S-cluster containining protein